jgi:ABC-2 family transporter
MADVETLCNRIILIDQGALAYDGDLAGLTMRLAPYKLVKIAVAGEPPAWERFGEVIVADGPAASLRVPRADVPSVTARLLAEPQVADLAVGAEPTVLYAAFWQLGRYPVDVYHPAVRGLLTYLVPVAFISSIPAHTLTHGADPQLLTLGLGAALGLALLARVVWRRGLRRYTSATS